MKLLELTFSDLLVGEDLASSSYKATPDSHILIPIPPECAEELSAFRAQLLARHKGRGFSIEWGTEGRSALLRITPKQTVYTKPLFIVRRLLGATGTLAQIGFPPAVTKQLLNQTTREGIVLMFGKMGSGKTTACYSYLTEYVTRYGGLGMTVENPVERIIEGRYGSGVIKQTEIDSEEHAGAELREMLRSSANIIMPPEIRSDETAREVLNIALTGLRVVGNAHARDLTSGLARYGRMTGGQNDAFSEAFAAAFYLSLEINDDTKPMSGAHPDLPGREVPPRRHLTVTPLIVTNANKEAVRSHIKSGNFSQLSSEIERQRKLLLLSGASG